MSLRLKMDVGKNIKLLFVDDEEEIVTSLSQALNRRGFEVNIALNGVTALEMVDKQKYDAVVLDVKMPDIDGIEVFNQIVKKYPDLPVIILTGHSSFDDAFQTSKDGVADYLSKPIEIEELVEHIKDAVSRARELQADRHNGTDPGYIEDDIRVMLVDDEVDFLESMKKILQRRRMVITTAESGEKALVLLKEKIVDIAIVDVKMPGMDGLDVLKRIKKDFPSVEVVLLTGHPTVDAALEGIKLGADEYLKKPPDIDELISTIRHLFQKRQDVILDRQKKLIEDIRRRYPD
jgi:DNA-binding NtrC family response regulator